MSFKKATFSSLSIRPSSAKALHDYIFTVSVPGHKYGKEFLVRL